MVALDPFMLDYLGWMMPLHVLLGVLALLALLLAATTREPLAGRRMPLPAGPRFHAWCGIAAGALLAAHVLMSSSRLTEPWRMALVAGALALPPLALPPALLVRRPTARLGRRADARPRARAGPCCWGSLGSSPCWWASQHWWRACAAERWANPDLTAMVMALTAAGLAWGSAVRLGAIAHWPLLATRFDHKFHKGVNRVTCHHNFVERGLGPKPCYACHKAWGTTELRRIDTVFHTFCTRLPPPVGCRRRESRPGQVLRGLPMLTTHVDRLAVRRS